MKLLRILVFLGLIGVSACSDLEDEDRITILNYLDTRNLVAIDTAGVYVVITKSGDQSRPSETSTIQFSYKGYYTDDIVFDQSPSEQIVSLKLSGVLEGLNYGLRKFGKKAEGTILIPSALGYGSNPPYGIRKNAILIYDVTVEDFN